MSLYPTEMQFVENARLQIDWNDGQRRVYAFKQLRDSCPCATCREKRQEAASPATLLPVLKPGELDADRVTAMRPVGSYAYAVVFADGHDSGIYSFELLRELGEVVQSEGRDG